jgi:hypothetical protein
LSSTDFFTSWDGIHWWSHMGMIVSPIPSVLWNSGKGGRFTGRTVFWIIGAEEGALPTTHANAERMRAKTIELRLFEDDLYKM